MMNSRNLWSVVGQLLLGSSVIAASNETLQEAFAKITPSASLVWLPCLTNFTCAKLNVPLDYAHPNGSRASVPLLRLAALPNENYKGMVLYNPGGPGGPGTDSVFVDGVALQASVGTNYDMVGFDPRGIGLAFPHANCSVPSPASRRRSMSTFTGPLLTQAYYDSINETATQTGAECEANIGGPNEAGPHMTTRVVVQDLISIVDAFAETKEGKSVKDSNLLNYLGDSYGTFIGQMFGTLFPERVGRLAIDGVTSPEDTVTTIGLANLLFTDQVFETFFIYCHAAGPQNCPYYTGNSALDIYNRFEAAYFQLDAKHATAQKWKNATTIENALLTLKTALLGSVYSPIMFFPYLGPAILALEGALAAHTLPTWIQEIESLIDSLDSPNPTLPPTSPEAPVAVRCSDNNGLFYGKTFDDIKPQILELEQQSNIGGQIWPQDFLTCTKWSIKSDDFYLGPWGGNTKNPILFISNTYDPITPITNSKNFAPKFQGAQILTIDGTGHTSSGPNNACAAAKILAYFQTGELPGKNSFCPLEAGPFGVQLNGTLAENIAKANLPKRKRSLT